MNRNKTRLSTLIIAIGFASTLLTGCASIKDDAASRTLAAQKAYAVPSSKLPSGVSAPDFVASTKIHTELAVAYFQAGRYTTALEVVNDAVDADPNNIVALSLQGLIYGELKDVANGTQSFQRAFKISPNDPDLNHNFGTFLCRNGREEDSLLYFANAIAAPSYSRRGNSHAAYGSCLVKLNRLGEARVQFLKAMQYEEGAASAYFGLANLEYDDNNNIAAKDALEKYKQIRPSSADSLWLSIRVAKRLGNDVEKNSFSNALERDFPNSEQAKKMLSENFN
jgi:type IV pilus assembly protein PilF